MKNQFKINVIDNTMEFTIFKKTRSGNSTTVQLIDYNLLISSIKDNTVHPLIDDYRKAFLVLESPEQWKDYDKLSRVCPVAEFYRSKAKKVVFKAYNGVSFVEIGGLKSNIDVEKAKKQVCLMPQVLCAFIGADGHSIVALTTSKLPDFTLPTTENDAKLFCLKAYITSVQCLQPVLDYQINVKQPTLDSSFLITYDENPYINPHPTPFIFEQPTEQSLKIIAKESKSVSPLKGMMPGYETYFTFTTVFNAAYYNALDELDWKMNDDEETLIICIAEKCHDVGLPQEEVVVRIQHHFRKRKIEEIRGTVQNIYIQREGKPKRSALRKHQVVAYRLREFLERRYDIRMNEVMNMTEFRPRQSFQFQYKELTEREQNTIHQEALLEGIEPTKNELDELIHSTFIPTYNPIEEYFDNLPAWDGKDYISELAKMVPTDNPYWGSLFKQWFLSMVAHWMDADQTHANSTAPILIGEQGFRKSTFCRLLLPPELQLFYTDSIDFRSNIEAERTLSRFMLVNIDEFDQLSDKQFAFVKHLFQKQGANIRRMYSETISQQRRYASFIGTTNCEEVLRDPTGNRRYLCVYVTDKIQTEQPINYAQLYSQAVHLIIKGTRYWINDEDEAKIKETNARFEVQLPLEQIFLTVFEPRLSLENESEGEWMRSTEIMKELENLPGFNQRSDNNLPKLGRVLTKLNIEKRRDRSGMFYLVKRK